jgi:penicillin-binding protein 1A
MVGGLSSTSFNRATQAFRQAGSVFKIYTFLCAFLQGLRHTDTVEDTPPTIGDWTPSNYMHREVGFVTLERAFAESINGATVRVAMDCGLSNIVNLTRIFGLTGSMPQNCSLILGSASVTLYQIAQTMLILANNGYQKAPYGIREIKTHDGTTIYTYSDSGVRLITDQDALDEMDTIMHSVIQKGTGRFAKTDKYPIRGKTGTSQDYRDLWFASISPFMIACAWCGHDDNSPMEKVTAKDVANPVVALCKEVTEKKSEEYEVVEDENQEHNPQENNPQLSA